MTDIDEFVIRNDESEAVYRARRFVSPRKPRASGTFFMAAAAMRVGRAPEDRFALGRHIPVGRSGNNNKFGAAGNNV
jgi:hypothetical protein